MVRDGEEERPVTNLFDSYVPTSDEALRAARGTARVTRKRRRGKSTGQSTTSALTLVASKKQQDGSGWHQLGEKLQLVSCPLSTFHEEEGLVWSGYETLRVVGRLYRRSLSSMPSR